MDPASLIDELIAREGGYVARPADKGGPTRFGITQAVAKAHGYAGDMAKLPRDTAVAIYRVDYWATPRLDAVALLAPEVAAELFDTGANMGTGTAAGFLRRALNALNRNGADYSDLPVKGMVDDAVLAALRSFLRVAARAARRCWSRRSMRSRASATSRWRRHGPPTKPSSTAGLRTGWDDGDLPRPTSRMRPPIPSPAARGRPSST